jgi:hypothetical protein
LYLCGVNYSFIIENSKMTITEKKKAAAIKEKASLVTNATEAIAEKAYFEVELAAEVAGQNRSVITKMLQSEIDARQARIVTEATLSPEYDAYIALLV